MPGQGQNSNLHKAKNAKKDEFYTQYPDIEKEVNVYLKYNPEVFKGKTILLPCDDPEWSNFTKFFAQKFDELGLKKLISTSYAHNSKTYQGEYQPSLFETEDPQFDATKTVNNGKIFILDKDTNNDGKINVEDLEWKYLEGDGDFRSNEIKKLRDEADIIVTNPPFSLFREFLVWIVETNKQFLIIGNMNAITYKEAFPLIKEDRMWLGATGNGSDMEFQVPRNYELNTPRSRVGDDGSKFIRFNNIRWFTNIDHGKRHQALSLMTIEDNRKFNSKVIKSDTAYKKYDNYEAIEVPFTNAIPSDYGGVMGVPISFLDKYNPEQFEIIKFRKGNDDKDLVYTLDGEKKQPYFRILIKNKKTRV